MQQGETFNRKFSVDLNVYENFLKTFGDYNPLHTNADFAKSKGFNAEVMHGNILNGFLSYFIGECLPLKNVIIHSQQINYNAPVYLNETLDFMAEIEEVHESVKAYSFKFYFSNMANKKVAKGKFQIGVI